MKQLARLAAEVLALDAKATKGPWTWPHPDSDRAFRLPDAKWSGWHGGYDPADAALIARYRTLAPQLARAVVGLVEVARVASELLAVDLWPARKQALRAALAALEPPDGAGQ